MQQPSAVPINTKLLGSGTASAAGTTVVWSEKLVTVVVPSGFTSTLNAKPVRLFVNAGTVPAGFENMLNAKVLPDVEVPSGELKAGPYRLTSNERVEPNLNPPDGRPWK